MRSKFKKIIKGLSQLSNKERLLAVQIAFWLIIGIIYKKIIPFKIITKSLGIQGFNPGQDFTPEEQSKILALKNLFCKVAFALPFHATCLVRAFAMAKLLNKEHITRTIYVGVNIDHTEEQKEIKAHAWVKCGNIGIIGCDGDVDYKVIGTFGREF